MEKIKHKTLIIFCLISLLIGVIKIIKIIKIEKFNKLVDSPSFVDHVPNPLLTKGVVVKE